MIISICQNPVQLFLQKILETVPKGRSSSTLDGNFTIFKDKGKCSISLLGYFTIVCMYTIYTCNHMTPCTRCVMTLNFVLGVCMIPENTLKGGKKVCKISLHFPNRIIFFAAAIFSASKFRRKFWNLFLAQRIWEAWENTEKLSRKRQSKRGGIYVHKVGALLELIWL